MLLVRTMIKMSEIHGLGCFALEDIKQGQVIWEFNPLIDLEFEAAQSESFPKQLTELLDIYCYAQIKNGKKYFILCGDHARHMNHSTHPNILEDGPNNERNIAARDIQAGEELTSDYAHFDADAKMRLGQ